MFYKKNIGKSRINRIKAENSVRQKLLNFFRKNKKRQKVAEKSDKTFNFAKNGAIFKKK